MLVSYSGTRNWVEIISIKQRNVPSCALIYWHFEAQTNYKFDARRSQSAHFSLFVNGLRLTIALEGDNELKASPQSAWLIANARIVCVWIYRTCSRFTLFAARIFPAQKRAFVEGSATLRTEMSKLIMRLLLWRQTFLCLTFAGSSNSSQSRTMFVRKLNANSRPIISGIEEQ